MDKETPPVENWLNLDEIEDVATKTVSRKAWGYYYSASDDKISKYRNTEAFRSIQLRPKVFIDCTNCDLSTKLLGNPVSLPIYVCPAAMARLGHPSGEAGIAEACRSFGALQIISNSASMTPEQIVAGATEDQAFGWQLYVQSDRTKSEKMLARINKLKAIKFIALTLDSPVSGKREDDQRHGNVNNTMTESSSEGGLFEHFENNAIKPEHQTEDQVFAGMDPSLTWAETLAWLAKHTALPIVLKGIQAHEDAYIAMKYRSQVKGIILSNHGGRSLDTAPPAVHTLLEIRKYCPEVFENLEVWIDGGIKRGTDVVKALCLGARGVGIGRAALWGLGAGGVDGVKRTLESMNQGANTKIKRILLTYLDSSKRRDEDLYASAWRGTCQRPWTTTCKSTYNMSSHTKPSCRVQIYLFTCYCQINTRLLDQQIYDGPSGLECDRMPGSSRL
ncbi:unnamed protein product [Penicillium salamii]|uniref:L-lactate dehydrogenase (cytochrome) n=1 Tax=Penicillium salamii TaxID=1612424 RepID=A0A9W4I824_9EURO|nr:unnamed protein product [Penicillium salamii]CAG8254404.1 unnamed protein product [Penicillium salamii]CAG8263818.1 unnamed protein product [Penicillium salamii]CAG8343449.1 unnamed protein product [Penicillium salamii]CAG8376435.1 unnamed protein product [Penicillium salamii]